MKELAGGMYNILGEGAFEYLAKAQELEQQGKKVLHFEIGQPDFPTPDHIKQAAFEAINNNFTGYVAVGGILELKEAIQEEVEKTRGFKPSLKQILVLPGAKPGIFFTMLGLINPGDEVIYPDPGFPTYGSVVQYLNAGNIPIPLKEENLFQMDPADIEAEVSNKSKLIILNSPHNPTGSVISKNKLDQIAAIAERHNIYILSDEVYSKMLYDEKFYSISVNDQCQQRIFLLEGFSKSYSMTGWRLGYLVGPEKLIEKMELLMLNALSCTTAFIQKAGIAALKGSHEPLNNMMATFRERRDAVVQGLNSIPNFTCLTPKGAFYAFPNISATGMSSREMADHILYQAGVCCLPGSTFGSYGEGYLRFSYATSIDHINQAITQIKQSL